MTRIFIVLSILALSACTSGPSDQPHPYEGYLKQNELKIPEPDSFDHCRGYGCAARDRVSLTPKEWKRIASNFSKVKNPESERKAISKAIGTFEQLVGPKTNTQHDVAGTFDKVGTHQLDCVDESINTTMYLAMLERKKLLKYHVVSSPTSRTPFTSFGSGRIWPHRTAVIYDKKSKLGYAVDSWYRDNGFPADVVDLGAWRSGWGPDTKS